MSTTATQILRNKLQQIHKENEEASSRSLREYLDRVLADVAPEPKRFGLVAEDWQVQRNERLIPAIEYIAGINDSYNGKMFFFENWAKGCDKSSSTARLVAWALVYAKKQLNMYVAAKDSEQANVIYNAIWKLAQLNPWIKKHLEFKRNMVTSKTNKSRLTILTVDAGGVQGLTPDFLICDELSTWSDRLFWDGLFGGAIKRSGRTPDGKVKGHCVCIILTNAGYKGTWQWELYQAAQHDPYWNVFTAERGKVYPSWMSPEVMASVRAGMQPTEARRLFDNEWLDPSEANVKFFSSEDIDACLGCPLQPAPGAKVYLGIDYAERRDRTSLAVVWRDSESGIVHVPDMTVWNGSPDKPIQLEDVEKWIDLQIGRFGRDNVVVVLDPYQTLYLIQKYEKSGQEVRKFEFRGGRGNQLMSENLKTLLSNRKLIYSLYTGLVGGSTLRDEMKNIIGKPKAYGIRMDHKSGKHDHDDRVVSLGICALIAVQEAGPPVAKQNVEVVKEIDLIEQYINLKRAENKGPQESIMDRLNRPHYARSGLFGV